VVQDCKWVLIFGSGLDERTSGTLGTTSLSEFRAAPLKDSISLS
jgi:hypothetical protein